MDQVRVSGLEMVEDIEWDKQVREFERAGRMQADDQASSPAKEIFPSEKTR